MSTKIGLFGIGLETYWPQFEGLSNYIQTCQDEIKNKLISFGAEVCDAGMVDNPQKAAKAADYLKKEDVQLIFLYVSTYALSATVLPIAQKLNIPIIILNIQPTAALNYTKFNQLEDRGKMTGKWLEYCQSCSVPEIACVFNRAEVHYDIVTGHLQDHSTWELIKEWVEAIRVANAIRHNRMGILGHYYGGMADVYTDLTRQSVVLGTHFEMLEMCELKKYRDAVTPEEIKNKVDELKETFEIVPECEPDEIERAARTSLALDKLVDSHCLTSMAYYYEGENGNDYENIVTSVIAGNTLLTGKNIPIAGECEIKTAQAMKIMAEFGAGGSFSEFYLIDFEEDVVMLGHDGPAHFAIAEGRVRLVPLPLYHGKPGKGLSIQMSVKQGPVTLLSVVESNNEIFFLVAEGESVPGPVLNIGNTNSRYRFATGARNFINEWSKQGPSHHCAISIGHLAAKIRKLGFLLNIPVTILQ